MKLFAQQRFPIIFFLSVLCVFAGISFFSFAQEGLSGDGATGAMCTKLKSHYEQAEVAFTNFGREIDKRRAWLARLHEDQDALTKAITALSGGLVGAAVTDSNLVCDRVALMKNPKSLSDEAKIACMNWGLGEVIKKIDETKKIIESMQPELKEKMEASLLARQRWLQGGCEVSPLVTQPSEQDQMKANDDVGVGAKLNPLSKELKAGKPQPLTFMDLVDDLQVLADETPNVEIFLGSWKGQAKIIKSNQTGAVGTSQLYSLDISKTDSGLSLRGPAGLLGRPELYQSRYEGNHLRVDYSGPYETPGLSQVQTTLTFWIDVTLINDALNGQMFVRSDSSFEGTATTKEFLMAIDLKRNGK